MKALWAAALAAMTMIVPGTASAQSFAFYAATHDRYNSEPISLDGTLTTDDGVPDPSGTLFTVSGGTGTVTYGSFTGAFTDTFDGALGSFRLNGGSISFFDVVFRSGGNGLGFVSRGGFFDDFLSFSEVGGPIEALTVTPLAAAAVPEPATWAMMIVGIGAAGTAMRRRRRVGALAAA